MPIQKCGCESDDECPTSARCDRAQGRCVQTLWTVPELCTRPFPADNCDTTVAGFRFSEGKCEAAALLGCEQPENLFTTLEECMTVCEGRPIVNDCPEGRVRETICVACGDVGGCGKYIDACTTLCGSARDCAEGLNCVDRFCQVGPCI